MHKKIFSIITVLLISLLAFAGCTNGVRKYNAKLYAQPEYLKTEFKLTQIISDNWSFIDGKNETIFVIKDSLAYKLAFTNSCPITVDFEKQMVIVYSFMAINNRDLSLKGIEYDSTTGELDIDIKIKDAHKNDTCVPYQRFLIIVMDKLNYSELNIDVD